MNNKTDKIIELKITANATTIFSDLIIKTALSPYMRVISIELLSLDVEKLKENSQIILDVA